MRKLMLAAAAVGALAVPLASRADAGALGGAEGLRAATDDVSVVLNVHCTPGRVHRRVAPLDGCWRRAYHAPVVVAPRVAAWGPGWGAWGPGWGWGRPAFGYAGWRPGIGIGRPWGWGGWRGGIGWGW
jgi:hypothetical protein